MSNVYFSLLVRLTLTHTDTHTEEIGIRESRNKLETVLRRRHLFYNPCFLFVLLNPRPTVLIILFVSLLR